MSLPQSSIIDQIADHRDELLNENRQLKQRIKRLEEFVEQLTNPKFTRDDLPNEALLQRIKRLEVAGNQLKDRYILENENWDLKTVNDWNEAKEAKP